MIKRYMYVLLLITACNSITSQNRQTTSNQDDLASINEEQVSYPEIGKPMPDFTLTNIQYYEKKEASLKDFKGKWLVLDFWNRYCVNCIKGFPKINRLRKQFDGKVEFILVGRNDGKLYSGSEKIYQRILAKYDLDLPLVYDATLFNKFGVTSVPHIIWIDDKGIVRAITAGTDLNTENLNAFLAGESPYVFHKLNKKEENLKKNSYDFSRPLLIDKNGGKAHDFLYRSLLTGKNNTIYGSIYSSFFYPHMGNKPGFSAINTPLKALYQIAYGDTIRSNPDIIDQPNNYGKWWHTPLLEVKDSSDFKINPKTGKGIYCYELIVPQSKKANTHYRQQIMQRDLKSYFGYKVTVEIRKMPYWKVKTTDKAQKALKTNGENPFVAGNPTKIELVNQPMKQLIRLLWGLHQLGSPFIDETGIEGNIDISLEGMLTDFSTLKKVLKENGIELEKGLKKMKVIVIQDPKEN